MPRTSKARVFRSTQTAPNSGNVRDLATTFGTAFNDATRVAYATGGTVTWQRWRAGVATGTAVDPATVTTAAGEGHRDTVGENTAESVRYVAGTWTVRVRLIKSDQALATGITVRIVAIVYEVTSAGAHVSEIGRVTFANLATETTALSTSGSFTTASPTTIAAGNKIQVECYITPLTAGLPAAPTAAVTFRFYVDDTDANGGSAITAIPGYDILYARALSVTGVGTVGFTRRIVAGRSFSVVGADGASFSRRIVAARSLVASGSGTTPFSRLALRPRAFSVTGAGLANFARRISYLRSQSVTGAGTVSFLRGLVINRNLSVTGVGTTPFARLLVLGRNLSASGVGVANFARRAIATRAFSVAGAFSVAFQRALVATKSFSVTGTGTVNIVVSRAYSRLLSVIGSGTAVLTKILTFDRRFVVVGNFLTRMRIDMPQVVLNRITGGGTVIINTIKKIFPVFDD